MRDLYHNLKCVRALSPVAPTDNTAQVSEIIDLQGYDSCLFVIQTGSLGDAGAEFTVLLEEGDNAALSDNAAVADADLIGTEALASFDQADDDSVFKLGYIGGKRYVRMTITPTNNGTAAYMNVLAILGNAELKPVA